MKPIKFEGCNIEVAKDQPEYLTLPAHKGKDGTITSCWEMSIFERIQILFTGKVYLQILTFSQPLQPQKLLVNNPIING